MVKNGDQKIQDNSINIANVNFIFLGGPARTLCKFCDLTLDDFSTGRQLFWGIKTILFAIKNLDGQRGVNLNLNGPFGCNEVCALVMMLWLFWPIPIIQAIYLL